MVTIADAQVDLFGSDLPGLEDLQKLSLYVNSSEVNRIEFGERIEGNSKNKLAAGIGLFMLGQTAEACAKLEKSPDCKEKYLYLGYGCRAMKDYAGALKHFAKAGKHNADSLVVSLEKTATYRAAGQLDEASGELSACSNFENVSADYHCQLGKLADANGEYADGPGASGIDQPGRAVVWLPLEWYLKHYSAVHKVMSKTCKIANTNVMQSSAITP